MLAGEAWLPGIEKHSATTESALAVSPSAGSSGSRAGGTTNTAVVAVAKSADKACTTRGVEGPKTSCQGKVEVDKNIPQERDSERKGEQSRVMEVPKISCWDVGKIVKSFDAIERETRLQFLDRVCERCGCEVAAVVRKRLISSAAVRDSFPS